MYGFNSRSLPEEEQKRRSGARPAQAPGGSGAPIYTNSNGVSRQGTMPPGARDVAPVNPATPKSPPAANFYTNPQGVTVDASKPIPSMSRDLVPVQGQKGGLPATTTQKPLGLPAPQQSPAPGAQGQADFFSNNRGQTARGFMPSSSRDIVTAPGQKGGLPAVVESPAANPKAGATASATTAASARDANLGAQAKNRARADSMAWQAEQQKTNEAFRNAGTQASTPKPATRYQQAVATPKETGARFGAGATAVLQGVTEGQKVADVANSDQMDGWDTANQAAEGFAKTAAATGGTLLGAKSGAALGAMTGPAAPFAVPVGALIGGAGGYLAGTEGVERLIEWGRGAFGLDPDSPDERLAAQSEEPAATQATQEQPAPEDSGVDNVGTLQPMPEQMPILQGAGNNNVIREGNSFSGGVVGQGFTVNGRPFQENINTMPSEQNRKAIAALMERTPEFGEGASSGGFQPGRGSRPNFYIGRDTSTQERAERAALRAASNPYEGAQNGQLTANQVNALRGLANDIRTDETSRANNQADNQSRLQQTDMIQQGENQRTGARLSIDQSRLEGEQLERGFRVRQAQEVEGLRQAYQQAQDPEQRSAIAEQLRILNGDSGQGSEFQAKTVEIPIDPNDPMKGTMEVPFTFSNRSGQWQRANVGVGGVGGPQPSEGNINALRMNKDNPEMIALFEARFGPGSAQQYLGDN